MANQKPAWMNNLTDEDLEFIKNFVRKSGSLKDMAEAYGVSYPTMRAKLDRLIDKITLGESSKDDAYVQKIKAMAIDGRISVDSARDLINAYRRLKEEE
jgi:hypothetical protein